MSTLFPYFLLFFIYFKNFYLVLAKIKRSLLYNRLLFISQYSFFLKEILRMVERADRAVVFNKSKRSAFLSLDP